MQRKKRSTTIVIGNTSLEAFTIYFFLSFMISQKKHFIGNNKNIVKSIPHTGDAKSLNQC